MINLHEAVLDEHLLDDLINVDKQDNTTAVRGEQDAIRAVGDNTVLSLTAVMSSCSPHSTRTAPCGGSSTTRPSQGTRWKDSYSRPVSGSGGYDGNLHTVGLHGFSAQER